MKNQLDIKSYLTYFKNCIKKLVLVSFDDKITVYAAQACYFVTVSVIPFLCLTISIVSFLIPTDIYAVFDSYKMPPEIKDLVNIVIEQLLATQNVSLLSISAVVALWTASRGCDSIRAGIENVYEVPPSKKIVKQQLLSLVNTFVLIAVLLANVILVLFGDLIIRALHLAVIVNILMNFGAVILFIIMCGAFAIIYSSTARHSGNERIRSKTMQHVPGALFATSGWMMFSYLYSLYIRYFPSASAIYGSLTAVCLIMLWLYICMIILLLGAEINKLWGQKVNVEQ